MAATVAKTPGQQLSDAAFEGNVARLAALLDSGVPIDSPDADGFSALHRSCVTGNVAVVKFLLERGANFSLQDAFGDSPLHYASFCGHVEVARALLAAGADPNKASIDGKTPLMSAQEEGHKAVVDLFLSVPKAGAALDSGSAASSGALKPTPPVKPAPPSVRPAFSAPAAPVPAAVSAPPRMTAPGAPPMEAPVAGGIPGTATQGPGAIAGLDLSRGVVFQGELRKKRYNKVMRWRKKYFVVSQLYSAIFFWTGTRERVEGMIKKVRFETILSLQAFAEKRDGKRFELRVITGRRMQLLAATTVEAAQWVKVIKSVAAPSMAAFRIQAAWRGYCARKRLRKLMAERRAAVERFASKKEGGAAGASAAPAAAGGAASGAAAGGKAPLVPLARMGSAHTIHGAIKAVTRDAATGKSASVDIVAASVLMEGELKKKNSTVVPSLLFGGYRTRYFVLYPPHACLYYFDTKAQRNAGTMPRAIPFIDFLRVTHVLDRRGQKTPAFTLRLTTGRVFELEARSAPEAERWISRLLNVLPRDNAAAIKIQARWRALVARRKLRELKAANADVLQSTTRKYLGAMTPANTTRLLKCVLKIQSTYRMSKQRAKWRQVQRARTAAEQEAVHQAQHVARTSRSARIKAGSSAGGSGAAGAAAAGSGAGGSEWKQFEDSASGRPYWHNAATGETTWTDPNTPVYNGWQELKDATSGRTYYHNLTTREVSWDLPADAAAAKEAATRKSRWIRRTEPASGRNFFANVDTGETNWYVPADFQQGRARLLGQWFSKTDNSAEGKYYVHSDSSVTTWDRPEEYDSDEDYAPDLLAVADWLDVVDPISGKVYRYNRATGKRMWVGNPLANVARGPVVRAPKPAPTSADGAAEVEDAASTALASAPVAAADLVPDAGGAGSAPSAAAAPASAADLVSDVGAGGSGTTRKARRSLSLMHDEHKAARARGAGRASLLPAIPDGGMPDAWQAVLDASTGRTYYYNAEAGVVSWTKPAPGSALPVEGEGEEDETGAESANVHEAFAFTMFVNASLAEANGSTSDLAAALASRLPVAEDQHPPALFAALRDGVLACALLHTLVKGSVDPRAISLLAAAWAPAQRRLYAAQALLGGVAEPPRDSALENWRLALSAAQAAGAVFTSGVTAHTLADGRAAAVLEFLWQIMRIAVVNIVSVRTGGVGILRLAKEDESAEALLALDADTLLLRWLNYQLARASPPCALAGSITSVGARLSDGVALCALVRALVPDVCGEVPADDAAATAAGAEAAVTAALSAAFAVGVPPWFSVEGITESNTRLQLALLAYLFRAMPGLADTTSAAAGVTESASASAAPAAGAASASKPASAGASSAAAVAPRTDSVGNQSVARLAAEVASKVQQMEGAGEGGEVEANAVAQWMNSLGLPGVAVRGASIVNDLRDGVVLLKLLDAVEPGIVAWSRVNQNPTNRYKMVENANMVVKLGRTMDFHLVNVAGLDIVDGSRKLIFAFMWQLVRHHTLKTLSRLAFDGFAAEESEVLAWANSKVEEAVSAAGGDASSVAIPSFSEPTLAQGMFLLYLLEGVVPGTVDWEAVADGATREEQLSNAAYILSLARRAGAQVFCTADDLVKVISRKVMLFVASLMVLDSKLRIDAEKAAMGATNAELLLADQAAAADDEEEEDDEGEFIDDEEEEEEEGVEEGVGADFAA